MAITVRVYSDDTAVQAGSKSVGPIAIVGDADVSQVDQIRLLTGFNTIAIPTNATGVVIDFPDANIQTAILKGVTGDTGITISPTGTQVLHFPATPQASFGITMGGDLTAGTFATFNWF